MQVPANTQEPAILSLLPYCLWSSLVLRAELMPFDVRNCSLTTEQKAMPGHRSTKYRTWTETSMLDAYHDVKERGMPIATAAKLHNVPRRSLGDRVNGKVELGASFGAPTKLSAALEEEIVNRIKFMSSIGAPLTISQIVSYAHTLDQERGGKKFRADGPSYNWWVRFRDAHPEAARKIKRPVPPSKPTDTTLIPESSVDYLREYFTRLKDLLQQYDLMDRPERIYYADEAIVDLSKSARPVVTSSRYSHTDFATRPHVAMVNCVSAAGAVMPPYVIFKGDFPTGDYATGGPDGCLYAKSENGFLDTLSAQRWFDELFLKHCRQDRDINSLVILIMDSPLSKFDPPFLLEAIDKHVIFIEQVPKTTNLDLPLDVCVYKSLANHIVSFVRYGQALQSPGWNWELEFPRLLKTPWEKAMSVYNIKEGFRQCGIYPYNPNAVDKEKLVQAKQITDIDVDLTALPVYKEITVQDMDKTGDVPELAEEQNAVSAIIIDQDRNACDNEDNVVIVTSGDCIPVEQEVETTMRTPTKNKRSPRTVGKKQRQKKAKKKKLRCVVEKETDSSEEEEDEDSVDSNSSDDWTP